MKYATVPQLVDMIQRQEVLNKKFNGEQWRKGLSLGWAEMAMLVEIGEMANEIKPTWAWWKNVVGINKNLAVFEFIDVIHFALLISMFHFDPEDLIEEAKHAEADMGGPVGDPHHYFIKAVNRFLRAVNNDDIQGIVKGLMNIIDTGAILLALGPTDVYKAYLLKNERNHERVDGGLLDGRYDKNAESELSL